MATRDTTKTDYRDRLLEGLEQALREKGLRNTQVADITKRARTSLRTFYECFGDKESCFVALFDQWAGHLADRTAAALDSDAPWEDQIDAIVDGYLEALTADPVLAMAFTRELFALGERGYDLRERDLEVYVEFLMDVTRGKAMQAAGVQPLDRDTATMIVGGFAELVERRIVDEVPLEPAGATMKRVIKAVIAPR
jgi:AcrR family transcriptional regulator